MRRLNAREVTRRVYYPTSLPHTSCCLAAFITALFTGYYVQLKNIAVLLTSSVLGLTRDAAVWHVLLFLVAVVLQRVLGNV